MLKMAKTGGLGGNCRLRLPNIDRNKQRGAIKVVSSANNSID